VATTRATIVRRFLYIAFFLEVGFVLAVAPWSDYWDRNYFLSAGSLAQAVLTNNFVRGAVSGLGLLNIVVGLADLAAHLLRRSGGPAPVAGPADDR
jgi:hypothetical protein